MSSSDNAFLQDRHRYSTTGLRDQAKLARQIASLFAFKPTIWPSISPNDIAARQAREEGLKKLNAVKKRIDEIVQEAERARKLAERVGAGDAEKAQALKLKREASVELSRITNEIMQNFNKQST